MKAKIILSEKDYNIFINAINNPPKPSNKLKEAFLKYKNSLNKLVKWH